MPPRKTKKPKAASSNTAAIDSFLASGGFRRSPRPSGALARSRKQRDARVEPKSGGNRRASRVEIIRAPALDTNRSSRGPTAIIHGFSTRAGGFSTTFGGYDLNLGGQIEPKTVIAHNRRRFVAAITKDGATDFDLVTISQIHSGIIHVIEAKPARPLAGDGLITAAPGLLLAIQVADCVPVLVADVKKKVVAAFHAGWRGSARRIVERGVGDMRMLFASVPRDLRAAIGPCIGGCCYAVGREVEDEFHSQFAYAAKLFHSAHDDDPIKKKYPMLFLTARAPGHGDTGPQTHLDLVEANRRQLVDAGLDNKNIWTSGLCTSCSTDRFFSHRKEAGFTGRMMAVIGIAPLSR